HEVNAEVPAKLSRLVMQLLRKDPEKRPPSAAAVAGALAAIEDDTQVAGEPPPSIAPTSVKNRFATRERALRRLPTLTRRPRVPRVAFVAVLAGLFGLTALLFGPVVLRVVSDEGELIIEIDDPQVEAIVNTTGTIVHDQATGRK